MMMMRGWEKGDAGAVKMVVTTAANDAMRIVCETRRRIGRGQHIDSMSRNN